jgi:hypothetical protein
MSIPVPALVDAALFDAVAEQLQENRERARVPQRGAKYLLQGLIVWARYAGMLITAKPLVQVDASIMSDPMPTTGVSVLTPIASVGCGCAGTSNCARIWWMKRSGRKSAGGFSIQSDWNRNIDDA